MSNILTATVNITGTRTLLWHYFGPDAIPLEKGERTGVAGNDPEEWRKTVLFTRERQLYLEPTYIFGALRDGARYTKKGRGTLQSTLAATLQVTTERVLIDRFLPAEPLPTDPEAPVFLDIRSVKNPNTKSRNVRYRVAASPGWKAEFQVIWDKTILSRSELQAVLTDAGRLAGLGDGRAIGLGRFETTSFAIEGE